MSEPLPADHHHLQRRTAPHLRQPLRAGRHPGAARHQVRPAQSLRLQVQAGLLLPAPARGRGHARGHRHPQGAGHVRELPPVVHGAHLTGLPRHDLGALQPRALRVRHGHDSLGERLLPGQARPRAHRGPHRQGHHDDLVPLRLLRARAGPGRRRPLQLPDRGHLPRGHPQQRRGRARRAAGRTRRRRGGHGSRRVEGADALPLPQPGRPCDARRAARRGLCRLGRHPARGPPGRGRRLRRGRRLQGRRARRGPPRPEVDGGQRPQGNRPGRTALPHRPRDQPRHPRRHQHPGPGGPVRGLPPARARRRSRRHRRSRREVRGDR